VVADLKNAGRKLFVWTVNSARDMKQLADWGVDGIISDDPKNLVATLRHK
jgi:glycerophosphoryl diester phosphodiesterase